MLDKEKALELGNRNPVYQGASTSLTDDKWRKVMDTVIPAGVSGGGPMQFASEKLSLFGAALLTLAGTELDV